GVDAHPWIHIAIIVITSSFLGIYINLIFYLTFRIEGTAGRITSARPCISSSTALPYMALIRAPSIVAPTPSRWLLTMARRRPDDTRMAVTSQRGDSARLADAA